MPRYCNPPNYPWIISVCGISFAFSKTSIKGFYVYVERVFFTFVLCILMLSNNVLPDDGVTALKHVGDVLM
jgi:hypothetical protein